MSFIRAAGAIAAIGPVARTSDLRSRGVTRRELTRAVSAGEVQQLRRGVYAAVNAPDAWVHAAAHGGVPACQSAARLHHLWVLDDAAVPSVHIWFGSGGPKRDCMRDDCAVVSHWDAGHAELRRLPPVRNVLLQIAVCAGEEAFFVALESALRKNLLMPQDLVWLGWRLPPALRWLLGFARPDADSGLESLVRLRLRRIGIEVRTQVQIDGVGEVDFVIDGQLIVEADGKENHDDEDRTTSKRHKDLVRDAKASALGYDTLRFDYALIVHDWPTVEAAIVAKLARIR